MKTRNESNLLSSLIAFFAGIGAGVALAHRLLPKKNILKLDEFEICEDESIEIGDSLQNQIGNPLTAVNNLELQKLTRENDELKKEYQRLLARSKESEQEIQDQERSAIFHALEPILAQLPVISERIKAGADIPVDTVLSLVDMIPEKLETLDIKMINTPGQITEFDPVLHKPVRSQTGQIPEKEQVKVIVPGFQYKNVVLKHSEVRMQADGK